MNANGVFFGKKILLITQHPDVLHTVKDSVEQHRASFFHAGSSKDAVGQAAAKNPDLIIFDDRMPSINGSHVLALIRRLRPSGKLLLLSRTHVPLRSIDASAQGASFTISNDSSEEQVYNAVKHCLAIASVPRIEQPVR